MEIVFNCSHCEQELSVGTEAAGLEIQCPTCGGTVTVPEPTAGNTRVENPIASSAAAKEDKHYSVPQREKAPETLIEKPLKPLEVAAKEGIKVKVKSIRHSDCVEVGRDRFDDIVSQFLGQVGESNIVSISAMNYSHQELATRAWILDYGVIVVYRG